MAGLVPAIRAFLCGNASLSLSNFACTIERHGRQHRNEAFPA
jgi:hypothetical protein